MAKKASFTVDVIGIPRVKRQVSDYAEDYLRQEAKITRAIERERAKREREYKSLFSSIEKQEKAQTRLVEQEEKKRAQIAKQEIRERERQHQAGGFSLAKSGHIAQAAGFYRTGHLLRAAGMFGIGSSGGGGGGGADALSSLGPAAMGLGLAFAGVMVASKLVEVGFQAASKVVGDFIGAISQLGGAKGLQAMIVESVTNVKLANQARFAVAPSERLSQGELSARATALSTNVSAGAFSKEEWLKAYGNVGTLSGKQRSFSQKDAAFIGQYANVHGMELGEASDVFARIQAQNPSWSSAQVKSSLLSAFGVGQTLSFNPSELPEATTLMRQTEFLSGDSQANQQKLLVAGGLIKPAAGGLQNAGVYIQNMLKGFRKGGVTNLDTILERVATNPLSKLPIHDIRGQNAAQALQAQLSERAGVSKDDFSAKANKARLEELRTLEGVTMTEQEFKKAVEESISPQEQLKGIFNDLSNELEGKFLEVVKESIPIIREYADSLIAHKDDIKDMGEKMIKFLGNAVLELPTFINMVVAIADAIGSAIAYIMGLVGKPTSLDEAIAKRGELEDKANSVWGKLNPKRIEQDIADNEKYINLFAAIDAARQRASSVSKGEPSGQQTPDPNMSVAPPPPVPDPDELNYTPNPNAKKAAPYSPVPTSSNDSKIIADALKESQKTLERIHRAQTQTHPLGGRT